MNKIVKLTLTFLLAGISVLSFGFSAFAEPDSEENQTQVVTEAEQTTQDSQTTAEAAQGSTTRRASQKSSNNELSSLKVIGKTQDGKTVDIDISPEFKKSTRTYSLSVPFEVVSLEIIAEAVDNNAEIQIPDGYLTLDVGENKSYVYVVAQNGSRRTYLINSVRAPEETTSQITEQYTETQSPTEEPTFDYSKQDEPVADAVAVEKGNPVYQKLAVAFAVIGAVLLAASVVVFIRNKKLREDDF